MDKSYNPQEVEKKWYHFWQEKGLFRADATSSKPGYCIVMPPPNITGVLHMGHALVNTLQDILIRYRRMQGDEVLWVPGTDHAGISTQTVVERNLMKTMGKRRKDFSREEFLSHVWKWKEENQALILNQLRQLGCSCDWSRLAFTMDEKSNKAVHAAFKKLYDRGLIYRGDYLVNWDPVTQTALADDEVEYEEQKTFLWYIRYSHDLTIATTRPETLLGDTAIAISKEDPRYSHLVGKTVSVPIVGRVIPVIHDHRVDPTFGSGAVKITPAHDPNDYLIGLDHNLEMINILTADGKINERGAPYTNLTIEEARQAIVDELKKRGLIEKIIPHINRVGVSYRSKAIIQPYLSKQWFLSMQPFKQLLREVVEQKRVQVIPSTWEHTYFHWIDHLRDWCISRQLWWGHRIPIWYKGQEIACPDDPQTLGEGWVQDEDVLDTWFSSALWPFSVLGWPDNHLDLAKFYPNATLITGHDILFFWVARMILMGEVLLEKPPFFQTFLHGLIYGKSYWRVQEDGSVRYTDPQERALFEKGGKIPLDVSYKWEKMSKTKGNVIDPIQMINAYGTDAVRMALTASATHARQIDLDERRFEEFKNFANKIWNGARFVFMNIFAENPLTSEILKQGIDTSLMELEDHWIFAKLNEGIASISSHFTRYEFDKAALESYDFFWKEFCAYYVEISKPVLFGKRGVRSNKQKILLVVLVAAIRLLHPIAPFITEELFQRCKEALPDLPSTSCPYLKETLRALGCLACIQAPFPKLFPQHTVDPAFILALAIVQEVRRIRAERKIPLQEATDLYCISQDTIATEIVSALLPIKQLIVQTSEPTLACFEQGSAHGVKIFIPLSQEKESLKAAKDLEKTYAQLAKFQELLANESFLAKAPKELIAKLQEQVKELEAKCKK